MILRIRKGFVASIAAAAIVVTGFSAAPARAGDDDAAAAIAALLGLAVIGAVIADKRKDKKKTVATPVHPKPPVVHPRPLPPRVGYKALPQHCLRSFRTDRGNARVFGQRCLERNYHHVHKLPHTCHRQLWTDRGWRYGYGARCLNRHGFVLARH